jgi:aspartate kinase
MLMTAGERISMSLLSIALNSIGCPAVSFTGSQVGIITDTRHTNARILEVRPGRVVRELEAGNVFVVGGFQGVSTAKDVTTLGRGGSDTTAVALAAALHAERCEILTDVDGVYTADPNVVPTATKIDEISFEDMRELARYGATVLKEDAVRFAEENGIALHVGDSASSSVGTIVLSESESPCPPVVGLSVLENVELVTWENLAAGSVTRLLAGVSDHVKFVTTTGDRTLAAVERAAAGGLISSHEDEASVGRAHLVCAAGSGAGSATCAAAAVAAIERAERRLLAMVSSGRSTVAAVEPESSKAVLKALHEEFFPEPTSARGAGR